jgi:carboxymuconolactone decarboxylase family protein
VILIPTRELITLSMLVALGGCDPQVKGHVAANLRVGNDRTKLIDVLTQLLPVYDQTPAHSFLSMLDPKNGLAPGDPTRMAARIIESVDMEPAPLRMVLGSQALEGTLTTLRKRIEGFEAQRDLAASTDFPTRQ